MKKIYLLFLAIGIPIFINAQILNLQTGISIAKQSHIFDKAIIGYSEYLGFEYLNKDYFNLNSNLGVHREGGLFKDPQASPMYGIMGYSDEKLYLDYFSLNTTIDFKIKVKEIIVPFIGIGPSFGILFSHNDQLDHFNNADELSTITYGLLINGGFKVQFSKCQVGLVCDYLTDFDNNSSWSGYDLKSKTILVNLILGYKLQ
jgi:hypothetical protein